MHSRGFDGGCGKSACSSCMPVAFVFDTNPCWGGLCEVPVVPHTLHQHLVSSSWGFHKKGQTRTGAWAESPFPPKK